MHNEISRPCGGRFGEQVAGNADKGEAPTILRERLEIRFDQNLHGLLARIDLDTNGRVAEVNLVASPVLSSNDSMRHQLLARNRSLGDRCSGSENDKLMPQSGLTQEYRSEYPGKAQ